MPSKKSGGKPTPRLFEDQFNDLHSNCLEGTIEDIENFFKNGNKIKHYDSGLTPLHVVVLSRRKDAPEVIDILLENGVDINAASVAEEKTALHLVAEHGDFPPALAVVVKLLEQGADTTLRDKKIRTAYDLALARNNKTLAATLDGTMDTEELQEYYYKKMAGTYGPYLIQAVIESDEDSIRRNIDFHADPNVLNQHGAGAIHYTITHCNLPTVNILQLLIDAGADVNLKDHENDAALNLAVKMDKLKTNGTMGKVVSLLLKHGADQTIEDIDGRCAYDSASKRGYNDIMKLLRKPDISNKREDSFVAQTPIPETPRRTAVEHPATKVSNRSPSKSPSKPQTLVKSGSPTKTQPEEQLKNPTPEPEHSQENQEEDMDDITGHEEAQMFSKKSKKLQKKSRFCTIS